MINNAAFPPVGILGLGFLGQILDHEFSTVPESWGTWHKTQLKETPIPVFLLIGVTKIPGRSCRKLPQHSC